MSKPAEKGGNELESQLIDARSRLIDLEARLKNKDKEIDRLKYQASKGKSSVTEDSTVKVEEKLPESSGLIPKSSVTEDSHGQKHTFAKWEAGCADCGEKNPDFLDETACESCGEKTGSLETALSLKFCPGCLKPTKVKLLNDEAKRKWREMVHA